MPMPHLRCSSLICGERERERVRAVAELQIDEALGHAGSDRRPGPFAVGRERERDVAKLSSDPVILKFVMMAGPA
jgi:hypothetical protein